MYLGGCTRVCTNSLSDQTELASSRFSRSLWWDQARDAAVVTSWVGHEEGERATECVCVLEDTGVYVCRTVCLLGTCGVVQVGKGSE